MLTIDELRISIPKIPTIPEDVLQMHKHALENLSVHKEFLEETIRRREEILKSSQGALAALDFDNISGSINAVNFLNHNLEILDVTMRSGKSIQDSINRAVAGSDINFLHESLSEFDRTQQILENLGINNLQRNLKYIKEATQGIDIEEILNQVNAVRGYLPNINQYEVFDYEEIEEIDDVLLESEFIEVAQELSSLFPSKLDKIDSDFLLGQVIAFMALIYVCNIPSSNEYVKLLAILITMYTPLFFYIKNKELLKN